MKNISNIPSPCYVLDEEKLTQNLQTISHVRSQAEIDIILAFKGFAMWSSFPLLKDHISGAAASSLNEVKLANEHLQVNAHTYCVAYDPSEFEDITAKSSHLTFNSLSQYTRFIGQVPAHVSVGLRVNPEWSDVAVDLYNPSDPQSRLGIGSSELNDLPDRVEGLHFHVLCESDSYALEKVLLSLESRFGRALERAKWVNMGGGHLMTETNYDLEHLIFLLKEFKKKHQVDIILEPGSAFAWQAGDLKTTVLDIVENGGVKTAIIDASFTCHMPDCLEMPYRPVIDGAQKEPTEGLYPHRLGGVSCLAGDYLDQYWFEKRLEVGDTILFRDMIHYTMVKTSTFNGIRHPDIGIMRKNGEFELVRRFAYEDYRDRLS